MGGLAHPNADLLIVYHLTVLHIRYLRPFFVPVWASTFLCPLSLLLLYFSTIMFLGCISPLSRSIAVYVAIKALSLHFVSHTMGYTSNT